MARWSFKIKGFEVREAYDSAQAEKIRRQLIEEEKQNRLNREIQIFIDGEQVRSDLSLLYFQYANAGVAK